MKDYYYIKFKPVKYDDEPYYLCLGDKISNDPLLLQIFEDIEKAVEWKHNKLVDEAYQATYMFEYYEMSIERL